MGFVGFWLFAGPRGSSGGLFIYETGKKILLGKTFRDGSAIFSCCVPDILFLGH